MTKLFEALTQAHAAAPALLKKWGYVCQIYKCQEELSELNTALFEYERYAEPKSRVIDEVADVLFTTLQMSFVFGDDAVAERLQFKINRTLERASREP